MHHATSWRPVPCTFSPGASGNVQRLLRGVGPHQSVHCSTADVVTPEPFDFTQALSAALGVNVLDAARAWVATNGPLLVGLAGSTTLGAFERHLGEVATILSGLGRNVADPAHLIAFDLARVNGDGRLDAFDTGKFGVGQPGLALPRLSVDPLDNAVVLSDGARRVRFGLNTNGTYLTPPGIADTLTANSGGWALTARDGTRRNYNASGLLVTILDTGLRTTTFTTPPRGSAPRPATSPRTPMSAAGRITSMTDPVSRVTTSHMTPAAT